MFEFLVVFVERLDDLIDQIIGWFRNLKHSMYFKWFVKIMSIMYYVSLALILIAGITESAGLLHWNASIMNIILIVWCISLVPFWLSIPSTFTCVICGRELPIKHGQSGGICCDCSALISSQTQDKKSASSKPVPVDIHYTENPVFTCEICKKELPNKYRHKGNVCVYCAEITSERTYADSFFLDDTTFIKEMKHLNTGVWHYYEIILDSQIYGWEMMKDWADYIAQADLEHISQVTFGSFGITETNITKSYLDNGGICKDTPELSTEQGMLSISGFSQTLRSPVKIAWLNQTRVLHVLSLVADSSLMTRYAETIVRRTFGTEDAMKLGKPIPKPGAPVEFNGTNIYIDSRAFLAWMQEHPASQQFELHASLPLTEREPTLCLFEDGVKTRVYTLQAEENEDFTGKYFLISVRLGMTRDPAAPTAQIDGLISDTPEDREITMNDIGYRIEGHYLACGGDISRQREELIRGQDLVMKGLKYPGYTTPSNIRLVGICPDCRKSFCFHGYCFYMIQNDVAYSDDGLDCCEIQSYIPDASTWCYVVEGRTFRYYNSFNCPHCGSPYIDYLKYPENKVFGVSGCTHLGRKPFKAP